MCGTITLFAFVALHDLFSSIWDQVEAVPAPGETQRYDGCWLGSSSLGHRFGGIGLT